MWIEYCIFPRTLAGDDQGRATLLEVDLESSRLSYLLEVRNCRGWTDGAGHVSQKWIQSLWVTRLDGRHHLLHVIGQSTVDTSRADEPGKAWREWLRVGAFRETDEDTAPQLHSIHRCSYITTLHRYSTSTQQRSITVIAPDYFSLSAFACLSKAGRIRIISKWLVALSPTARTLTYSTAHCIQLTGEWLHAPSIHHPPSSTHSTRHLCARPPRSVLRFEKAGRQAATLNLAGSSLFFRHNRRQQSWYYQRSILHYTLLTTSPTGPSSPAHLPFPTSPLLLFTQWAASSPAPVWAYSSPSVPRYWLYSRMWAACSSSLAACRVRLLILYPVFPSRAPSLAWKTLLLLCLEIPLWWKSNNLTPQFHIHYTPFDHARSHKSMDHSYQETSAWSPLIPQASVPQLEQVMQFTEQELEMVIHQILVLDLHTNGVYGDTALRNP